MAVNKLSSNQTTKVIRVKKKPLKITSVCTDLVITSYNSFMRWYRLIFAGVK